MDGAPHVVPIWFVVDDDGSLVFNTGAETTKGRALGRDPRVSICVDDETPPYSFVRVDGLAKIPTDTDEMLPWATAIARRYVGDALAVRYGRRNAVPGELLVRVRPTRVVALGGSRKRPSDDAASDWRLGRHRASAPDLACAAGAGTPRGGAGVNPGCGHPVR